MSCCLLGGSTNVEINGRVRLGGKLVNVRCQELRERPIEGMPLSQDIAISISFSKPNLALGCDILGAVKFP